MGTTVLGRRAAAWLAAAFASLGVLLVVSAAQAADDVPPVAAAATLTPAPDGNANWRRQPATLNLSATDDVAVAKFQYSLDGGATYIDVPVTPGPSASASVVISQEGNTTLRYRAVDTSGNSSRGATTATTLNQAAAAGATAIRLASTTGRSAGDILVIGTETFTIASIVTPAPPAPAPNVNLSGPLVNAYAAGTPVSTTPLYQTIAVLIDTFAPIGSWPQIVDDMILQSQTITPTRTDPRRRDATDTANGSGGSAIRRMEVDGEHVIPQPLVLNRLTVGKHTQAIALQDAAGNALKYTNTFLVTTSFDDLETVVGQLETNALRTTLNGAIAAGATGVRLQTPFGFRAGQTIVIDSGANQETATIEVAPSPPPTLNTTLTQPATAGDTGLRVGTINQATIAGTWFVLDNGANQELLQAKQVIVPAPADPLAPNIILEEPLASSHAAGTATTLVNVVLSAPLSLPHATGVVVANPRPLIASSTATTLRALLQQAEDAAGAGNTAAAIAALRLFKAAVLSDPGAGRRDEPEDKPKARAALISAADALVDQVKGKELDTAGLGVTTSPWTPIIRQFVYATPYVDVPGATYKVLVNGQTRGFRHEHIPQTEWMVQQLGQQHGFNVEIWDPNLGQGPGQQAPPGTSLTESPLLDLNKLMEYDTLVFASTVGINAAGLNATELANLQAYIRAGGGIVAIHGATDSMQNIPWYMDLVGAGFTNHGSNAGGIMPDCGSCGEVEFINFDQGNFTTNHVPERFITHEEVYNTNRNPMEYGIVHPLMGENEDTLVGQIGYGTGSLMNSDNHAMTWCRNFDGGRSFTTVIGHSWAFTMEEWYRQMILKAIQSTAGVEYANCVTYKEVMAILAQAAADGEVGATDNEYLAKQLADAKAAHDAGDYQGAIRSTKDFVAQTEFLGLDELTFKGNELIDWAKGLE